MDMITRGALSVDSPLLQEIGMLMQNPFIYAALVLGVLFLGERRQRKQIKILLSLALTLMLVTGIKNFMEVERPCVEGDWCPTDYSFPSMHAAIAFTLMTAFLNKKSYIGYLFFALFVSFTRLNIGVHTFYDIAGALPIALLSYYLTVVIYRGLINDE